VSAHSLIALLALSLGGANPPARPRRILSLNLCADQLLLQLVDPERIAGVTFLASDPDLSVQAERARAVPITFATAEEVLLLQPDLALVGQFWTADAAETLRRLHIPRVEIAPAESLDDVRRQLAQVADAVGEPERARAILASFDAELARLRARRPVRPLRALLIQQDGTTFGKGTLGDEVLSAAGYENLAGVLGLSGVGTIDLERLLLAGPELLVSPRYRENVPTLGREYLRHPILAHSGIETLSVPFAWLACGTTQTLRAVQTLVDWRDRRGVAP
jgi:iron complex transport system substrate-binding protein